MRLTSRVLSDGFSKMAPKGNWHSGPLYYAIAAFVFLITQIRVLSPEYGRSLFSNASTFSNSVDFSIDNIDDNVTVEDDLGNPIYRSLLQDLPHPSMTCNGTRRCCIPWDVNVDEWRTHHPDWHIVFQDHASYCFAKYEEPKASFFRELYRLQWLDPQDEDSNITDIYQRTALPPSRRNCSNVFQNFQINSGMGASTGAVLNGLFTAHQERRPYQINSFRVGFQWMYAANDKSSWAWCPTTDLKCYILPVGNCVNTVGFDNGDQVSRPKKTWKQYKWLGEYLMRFQYETLVRIRNESSSILGPKFNENGEKCTAIHVRRGDAGLSRQPFRRYAGLAEYIKAGNISKHDLVLILTDDQSTIYEAETFYPDYTWTYMRRSRVNITYGGFENHIPSGDPAREFVSVYAESMAAARCNKIVHGNSGFVTAVIRTRQSLGYGTQKEVFVKTAVGKEEARYYMKKGFGKHKRAEVMLADIYRDAAVAFNKRKHANGTEAQ